MLGRLAAKDNKEKRPFKPQVYQSRGRGQNRGYNQRNYHNRNRLNNRSSRRERGQFRQDRGRPRFEQSYRKNNFQDNARGYGKQTAEGSIEMIIISMIVTIEVGIDQERGHSQEVIVVIELQV